MGIKCCNIGIVFFRKSLNNKGEVNGDNMIELGVQCRDEKSIDANSERIEQNKERNAKAQVRKSSIAVRRGEMYRNMSVSPRLQALYSSSELVVDNDGFDLNQNEDDVPLTKVSEPNDQQQDSSDSDEMYNDDLRVTTVGQ